MTNLSHDIYWLNSSLSITLVRTTGITPRMYLTCYALLVTQMYNLELNPGPTEVNDKTPLNLNGSRI